MAWERAMATAAAAALLLWLAFDSRLLTADPAPPGTSAALAALGAIFGFGAFVMAKGGQPARAPLLAGLGAALLGYAVARLAFGF